MKLIDVATRKVVREIDVGRLPARPGGAEVRRRPLRRRRAGRRRERRAERAGGAVPAVPAAVRRAHREALGPRRPHRPGGREPGRIGSLRARPTALHRLRRSRSWSTRQPCACCGASRWGHGRAGISPDGRSVALGGEDGSVAILDLRTGERRTLSGRHEDRVQGLVFSPDGRTLATNGRRRQGADLGPALGRGARDADRPHRPHHPPHRRRATGARSTPAGSTTGSSSGTSPGTGASRGRSRPAVPAVRGFADSRRRSRSARPGRTVAAGLAGRRRAPARRAHPAPPARPPGHRGRARVAGRVQPRRPDDRRDGRARHGGDTRRSDGPPRCARRCPASAHPAQAMGFSPDGGRLAVADLDGNLRVLDLETGEVAPGAAPVGLPDPPVLQPRRRDCWRSGSAEAAPSCATAARSGVVARLPNARRRRRLAGFASRRTAGCWPSAPSRATRSCGTWPRRRPIGPPLSGHEGDVLNAEFSPDGRMLATSGDDGTRDPLGRRVAPLARNAPRAPRLDVGPLHP